jgi:PKD repeat protein
MNGGAVTTAPSGGVTPYSYLWNTGATTASISNLPAGGYSVTVTDANGCPRHAAFIVDPPDSCFNVIEGVVFHDANGNCIMDAGESPIPNTIVNITPGGAVMTGLNGEYSYRVNSGTYSLQVYPRRWQTLVCPISGINTSSFLGVGNVVSNVNFAIDVAQVQEIGVYSLPPRVRPGRTSRHHLQVQNNGSVTVSGTLFWEHDSLFTWVTGSPAPNAYSATSRTADWNFFNLAPFSSLSFWAEMTNDTTTLMGTPFTNTATLLPIIGDSIPTNNTLVQHDTVRASYDPNDKQVTPRGMGPLGLIEQTEQQMQYTVRFQNTGNDTAFYVVIRDTIDTRTLDIFSFQSRLSSHPYQLSMDHDSILVFRFNNINLPDSATNPLGSQGFVSFELSHNGTLPIGTRIENRAAIYFDFNDPIITNTVLNTVFAYPSIDLVADTTLCDGQIIPAQISSPGLPPYNFSWSDGNNDLNNASGLTQTAVNGSGTYQLTVTDALGVTANASVVVTANPLADAAFSFTPVGLNVAFSNTSSVNTTWFWDFGDGNTATGNLAQVHTYAALDKYTVTLIVTNDCGSDTLKQEVDLRNVAIDVVLFAQSIQLMPHPLRDVSYLRFDNVENAAYRLRILDAQGRVIQEMPETRGGVFEISRGNMAAGIYMYELVGTHSYYGKMVVK